jgi:hypothetical protein
MPIAFDDGRGDQSTKIFGGNNGFALIAYSDGTGAAVNTNTNEVIWVSPEQMEGLLGDLPSTKAPFPAKGNAEAPTPTAPVSVDPVADAVTTIKNNIQSPQEVVEALKAAGYTATLEEAKQFAGEKTPEQLREEVNAYANPRVVTAEEAKAAYEALTANKPKDLKLVRSNAFNKGALLADVLADNQTLQTIIDRHGAWDPAHDSKLNKLAELISSLEPQQKLLVFSEYADSISYLERHLRARLPNARLGAVSGRSSDPTYVARCFSPQSNMAELGGLPEGEEELQVLLATDVLSEGQNLQDAAMILNWDLPWTIIKIIQRAGRVDRVGQKSETIEVYSFKPHNGVEQHLELLKRLRSRLELNQSILGGGETIFADHIEDSLEDLFDGKAALVADEGDVDYASHALGLWNKATDEERAEALAMGKGSHSTMVATTAAHEPGVIAYTQATKGEDQIFDLFALRTSQSKVRTLTQMEALRLTENDQHVSSADLIDHHDQVGEVVKGTLYPQAAQKPLRINVGPRKKLLNFFESSISELALDDPIRLEANLLHSNAVDHALLKSGETLVNQILLRVAKGFVLNRNALLDRKSVV